MSHLFILFNIGIFKWYCICWYQIFQILILYFNPSKWRMIPRGAILLKVAAQPPSSFVNDQQLPPRQKKMICNKWGIQCIYCNLVLLPYQQLSFMGLCANYSDLNDILWWVGQLFANPIFCLLKPWATTKPTGLRYVSGATRRVDRPLRDARDGSLNE